MKFKLTSLSGAFLIEPDWMHDERGAFARTFCQREFAEQGLASNYVQSNVSTNLKKGTVRGMHFQKDPKPEAKLVRCTKGRIFDVIVDLRPQSKTYLQWVGQELSPENGLTFYIPEGFAHGFQTLEDHSEVSYQMSEFYEPSLSSGIRFNDPKINVQWSLMISQISDKDKSWPLL